MGNQQWKTPQDFFDLLNSEFNFQLDAAASHDNAKCATYYTEEDDALSDKCPWVTEEHYRVFINPGFKNMKPWIEKAIREVKNHPEAVIVIIGLVSPSAKWFSLAYEHANHIRLLSNKRLQFVAPDGVDESSNSRENCVVIFDHKFHETKQIYCWDWSKEKINGR